ncbi:hypothetical protein ACIRVK_28755 [Streptomyces sp. NPDC101152]|uniref:hypothetical protein n=1 Tax=Streptomyces sp. NPDC101152 TaxID=3366116 RepID=UPI00380EB7FF
MDGTLRLFATGLVPDDDAAATTVSVAEAVQGHLTLYEFIQWPLCPGHGHPMRPSVEHDKACRTCPASHRSICAIGELPPPDPSATVT